MDEEEEKKKLIIDVCFWIFEWFLVTSQTKL